MHNAWLWFYIACMGAGALLFQAWQRNPKGVPNYEYAVATFIPVWSGLAYLSMVFGQGIVSVNGKEVYLARYLDWIVTTPLLLAALAWTAMFHRPKQITLIVSLMGADAVMILTGLIADVTADERVKWLWYAIGCAALLVVFSITWGSLRRIAYEGGEEIGRAYTKVAGFLSVLWVAYPAIWAIGPSGAGLITRSVEVPLFVIVPILSKVGFSILDLGELRRIGAKRPSPDAQPA